MLSRPLKAQFLAAIRRMLRPVVRQLIAYGVSYPTLSGIMKDLYIEVAEREFSLPFKRQTDSRLGLVTGINRKEVAALRRRRRAPADTPEVEDTPITHLIGRWMAGFPYSTGFSTPRALPYEASSPDVVSFTRLVKEIGVDVPPRSVLDELLRIGAVELQPNGYVVLSQQAHIPAADTQGKITLLGSDPGELFRTIVHNIEHEDEPHLQRKVVYDNIGSQALPALREQSRHAGEEFLRQANSMVAVYDRDRNPQAPRGQRSRVVLGVYYFEEAVDTNERQGQAAAGPQPAPPGRIRRSK